MTTQIGDRFWTYYPNGIYPCTCFFCKDGIETGTARWHSRLPTSVYCCNDCFDGSRVLPGLYPETHQARFDAQKASEVVVDARTPPGRAMMPSCKLCAGIERCWALVDVGCGEMPGDDGASCEFFEPIKARDLRIHRAHEENMESAKATRDSLAALVDELAFMRVSHKDNAQQTRNCIALLVTAINELTKAVSK